MDRDFHTDDFERLLREKSDEFRMYPSNRIWNSIYNNIHPGRKWPSVVMCITLITSLFLIGYLNSGNTNLKTASNRSTSQKTIDQKDTQFIAQKLTDFTNNSNKITTHSVNGKKDATADQDLNYFGIADDRTKAKPVVLTDGSGITQTFIYSSPYTHNSHADVNESAVTEETTNSLASTVYSELAFGQTNVDNVIDGNKSSTIEDDAGLLNFEQKTSLTYSFENLLIDYPEASPKVVNNKIILSARDQSIMANLAIPGGEVANSISLEDKNWIGNYALYNRPAAKKWANKLAFQAYATPSVVYRKLYNEPDLGNTVSAAPFAISTSSQDINSTVTQKPSFGFEMGTGFLYSIFKGVQLKAGLQMNFTRYNAEAFQNTHPVATQLTMIDLATNTSYQVYRATAFSNKSGLEAVSLHNETFQFSLPIGADFKLIGNEKLQWNIGATIQPTYVIAGKSYLISSDRYNYVKETTMLNKWNLNAGFETFVSYKVNGLTWQLGPQFRTQLLSTNSKKFAVAEKLVSYGLKFGVSKTIK